MFVGDSLTRYQYLSLVTYLHTGQWSSGQPSSVWQLHGWSSFEEFFFGSNARLGCNELCDCSRPDNPIKENRFYRDCKQRIAVTAVMWFNDPKNPVRVYYDGEHQQFQQPGNSSKSLFESPWCPTDFKRCQRRLQYDSVYFSNQTTAVYPNAVEFLRSEVLPAGRIKPDVLVFNQGLWPYEEFRSNATLQSEVAALLRACVAPGGRAIWKRTTQMSSGREVDSDSWVADLRTLGLEIFDAYVLTKGLAHTTAFYDRHHFVESVYVELNKRLLDQICP